MKSAVAAAAVFGLPASVAAAVSRKCRAPNIIFLLADDLGYGDVGWLFQNNRPANEPRIATPNLDRLAREGITLTNHYSPCPVCAPSRASLMTGKTQGHCSLRNNQFDNPIHETATLASVLRGAGYGTYAVGKWGIAGGGQSSLPRTSHPLDRGFDHFYGFLDHLAGHTYYHYEGFAHKAYMGVFDDRVKATESAVGIYSTDLFTARAKRYITDHVADTPDKPFFLYFAINAVHGSSRLDDSVPHKHTLHVPGRPYPATGVQWPLSPEPREARNTWIHPDYRELPPKMARYATTIRRMDDAVGDLMRLVHSLGIDNDTILVFSSDNGPADENGADTRFFTSAGPFDGLKRDVYEGGVREPTFARWPGHIAPAMSTRPGGFWDWLPTFATLAGAPEGIPADSDGISLVPTLLADGRQRASCIYTEYNGGRSGEKDFLEFSERKANAVRGEQQMIRIGDYVALRAGPPNTPLRLYNVARDPYQRNDLANDPAFATTLAMLKRAMTRCRRVDPCAPRPYDATPVAALTAAEAERYVVSERLTCDAPATPRAFIPDFWAMQRHITDTRERLPRVLNGTQLAPSDATREWALRGLISVPATGNYTFTRNMSEACHVRIHDASIFAPGSTVATVCLEAGFHAIRVNARAGGQLILPEDLK